MYILYNILHIFIILFFFPLIILYVAAKAKYRRHVPRRLGYGLVQACRRIDRNRKTVWIHALSVGEVTSAIQLTVALRETWPDVNIVFSAATSSGLALAKVRLRQYCTAIIASPLDVYPVVGHFCRTIAPDLFVLVETDFWPNILRRLQQYKIPAILINGRISEDSFQAYRRSLFFFGPLFNSLTHLCVQSSSDKEYFQKLGVNEEKISTLGNLKYARVPIKNRNNADAIMRHVSDLILTAGSTHQGEEEILLRALRTLRGQMAVRMIIAPRDIARAEEIRLLTTQNDLTTQLHTDGLPFTSDVYILNTIGELTAFYAQADICFVGGSLIDERGHNPLEAAALGKPVIFGPFMDDFRDIASGLVQCGGGFTAGNDHDLTTIITEITSSSSRLKKCGQSAENFVDARQDVIANHIALFKNYL